MAIPLDGQALGGLFSLEIKIVPDDDSRVRDCAPGYATCDGSCVFIRESEIVPRETAKADAS